MQTKNRLTAVLVASMVALVTVPLLAVSDSFDDAFAAYDRGNYAIAARKMKTSADEGNAMAQFTLGLMYENGQGVPKDYAEANKWYRLSAAQAEARLPIRIGNIYTNGQGVPQDYAEAVKWYILAGDRSLSEEQHPLGSSALEAHGVRQDYHEAVKWYRRAAEQGNASAQLRLGFSYAEGKGVPEDYVQAHKWIDLAITRFPPSPSDMGLRHMAIDVRDSLAEMMTPQQIAEARRLAREWKPVKGDASPRQ